jgi:hypothetical protein
MAEFISFDSRNGTKYKGSPDGITLQLYSTDFRFAFAGCAVKVRPALRRGRSSGARAVARKRLLTHGSVGNGLHPCRPPFGRMALQVGAN